ncbi:ENTPD6 isoform 10 [Pongo abelii]|uniref:nucleoside diphosphate phosphatase n=1 Tax=Pongo abelii TaxID=9601 RepID=A0A2J8S331_PONAB|nr:ENTPD6 isoform 10 [Pongo abelii]
MRKISNHGSLRVAKVAYPLGLCVGLFIYVAYIKWHRATTTQAFFSITRAAPGAQWGQQAHSPLGTAADGHEVFYGIMFDAGSTGTRVHIFQFTRPPRETPTLTHETFKALKPGLSAYADDVEKSAQGIQELLDVAKQDIPFDFWKATPLVLKATAGLRLLPGEKAQKLLQKVKEVFKASPFLVGDDCVSIMNGTDEGVSAWITINFLTDAEKGGSLVVGDFEIAAKYVCRTLETQPQSGPFACMDLTYVSLLLQEFGFPRSKVLKLTRKIDNVETSWALGAIFHYIDSLNRQKSPAS